MEYHVRPMGRICSVSGKELPPGSLCHSVLVEKDGQLARLDISDEGWTGPPAGMIGHWRTRVPTGSARPKPLDGDALLRSFELMSEDASPANERFRYVLALLLLQRRKLQITATRGDGAERQLEVTGMRGEGPWSVRDFRMDEAEIDALQAALTARIAEDAAEEAAA